jgi:hypothetical protein
MKKIQFVIVIALAALLVACAPGRYTGGGWIQNLDGSKGPEFNIQNVSAADCDDDDEGIAETFKGKVKWNDKVNGVSFVCEASGADGVGSFTIEPGIGGQGIYFGVVSNYVGTFPYSETATTCTIDVVYPPEAEGQVKGVSVLLDNGYISSGTVGGGNIQLQKVNTKGICSSSK